MKKIAKLLFASAALLFAFVSCQKVDEVTVAPKVTHTVRFTTEMPTKTSYVVEENSVKYSWEYGDKDRLHVFDGEEEGTINSFNIDEETGVLSLEVSFNGSSEGSHTYTAYLNGAVKSEQVETSAGSYDPTCDVLVAKPIQSSELGEGSAYTFYFRRPVAITELKLKGLQEGETVSKVTIVSDATHPIAGKYTQSSTDDSTGDWSESSNKIVVTFGTEQDGTTPKTKTIGNDGILPLSIVTRPIKEASVKVLVETTDGKKYRKVTASALTLFADVVKAQGIGLAQVSEAEHTDAGWYLVTDASELFDGDEIRIASPANSAIAGALGGEKFLAKNNASFTPETYNQLTGTDSENAPETFTLVEKYSAPDGVPAFELVSSNGKLGTTAVKTMSYDDGLTEYKGVTEWTIAIDNKLASIGAGTYGRIQYNVTSPRFVNYTSDPQSNQVLPWIYKKYGDASEPILKKTRTASFSPEKATVTIGAQGNVFPVLSFEPEEATGGEQSWTSSNTEVATVNATTGEVTLVSDGTTTISVEIAETETYQPCSAEYVLTVNPAAEEGVDLLNLEWTGVEAKTTYADWSNKVGDKSGNTYAGNSAGDKNSIQLRTTNSNSGIVVTSSASNQVAKKITVDWNTETASGRTIDIYGKSTAYSSAADLYSSKADIQGTKLGSIVCGTSTELVITDDYEYIGIRSSSSALYLNWIKIQWEDPKPEYNLSFWNVMEEVAVKEYSATVLDPGISKVSCIQLRKDGEPVSASSYESSNTDVATVDETGTVTLKKKGDATITATLDGDDTHRTTEISYTLHVANVLSSIKLAEDSEQLTTFYVGQGFSFAGIKLEADYNDGEKKTLTADDLTEDNFSGFDSSAAVESQTITVSYTDGATETTTYNVEIKPLVTLYGITVPAEDANGNSITVKGALTEAPEGAEIELNVNLNTEKGYKLTSLKVNDVEHSSDVTEGKYTFTMPAEAVTVTANFDNHYNVVLGSATNGSFTVNGGSASPVSVVYGTTVNLVATPATGYVFKKWTVEGATVATATSATTSFTMPASEVTVNAMFAEPLPTIVIDLNASGASGSSYSNSNFVVGGVSFSAYGWMKSTNFIQAKASTNPSLINTTEIPGIIKSITVVTGSGKTARAVTVYGGTSSTLLTEQITSPTTAMTMVFDFSGKSYSYFKLATPGNACYFDNITIEYDPSGYTPTNYSVSIANDIQNGSVSATPTSATAGTEITLTATPDDGYSFGSWDVKDASDNPITVTDNKFRMPASNVTVSATFNVAGQGGNKSTCLDMTTKAVSVSSYNTSTAYGDWTIVNGANNNKGWEYFKMGGKSATISSSNPCYIYNTVAISHSVKKITVHLPSGSLSKSGMSVNSWGVYVYSDSNMTTQVDFVAGGTITNNEGSFDFTPSAGKTWNANYYYKISWDLANTTTTNGIICVDKITLYENN